MSLYQDFKNWITIWVLTFAFSFPKTDYPRRAIHYLQMFLYRSRSDWIHREESRGHWIAEDLKRNAKREAITDRISEANVIFLWIPGKHCFAVTCKQDLLTWVRRWRISLRSRKALYPNFCYLDPCIRSRQGYQEHGICCRLQ